MTSPRRLNFDQVSPEKLTHYIFRYPAKFHPPVVRTLIKQYSKQGDVVADPFCGSGTLMVEALTLGRHAIGSDVDPLAVFVSRVKTRLMPERRLNACAKELLTGLNDLKRTRSEYIERQFSDLTEEEYLRSLGSLDLQVPSLPNITHWFRRYVIVDLALLREAIRSINAHQKYKDFFMLCFASIIRNASNADPVPVSGLEVTSHMRQKDLKGRIVDPFTMFERTVNRSITAISRLGQHATERNLTVRVVKADATRFNYHIRTLVDAVITSPPYHNAVDYYRRHTLEMYWLDLVKSPQDRLNLLPNYIGRYQVPKKHRYVREEAVCSPLAQEWERKLRSANPGRADAFKHYAIAMKKSLCSISRRLKRGQPAVFLLGKNTWNGEKIPTVELFKELASRDYCFERSYWYPLKNRYMTYSRKNGANINEEYVLVFRKK